MLLVKCCWNWLKHEEVHLFAPFLTRLFDFHLSLYLPLVRGKSPLYLHFRGRGHVAKGVRGHSKYKWHFWHFLRHPFKANFAFKQYFLLKPEGFLFTWHFGTPHLSSLPLFLFLSISPLSLCHPRVSRSTWMAPYEWTANLLQSCIDAQRQGEQMCC